MQNKMFLYREIYQKIKNEILMGAFLPEDKIPSEDELAQKYSVSKITIKRALELLKEEGIVERIQGRGTFICHMEPKPAEEKVEEPGSRLIGMVLEHVSSAFGLEMMYTMGHLLEKEGYKLCIRFSFGSIEKETEEINDLLKMNIVGMIIMPCHEVHYNMTILKLILEKFPVVLVDKRMHGLPINSVCTDGQEAMRQLVHHMKERGCENAALMTIDPSSTSSLGDRAEGFYKGLEETQMVCAGDCILPKRISDMPLSEPGPEPQYVREIGNYLDSLTELPQGIVCTEYAIARALYAAAVQRNLKVGEDFKACCMDEDSLATQGYFFTHVSQDEKTIAEKTVEILMKLLAGTTAAPLDVRVPAIFHMGKST